MLELRPSCECCDRDRPGLPELRRQPDREADPAGRLTGGQSAGHDPNVQPGLPHHTGVKARYS